jgi:RNA-directed DNA polymerase
MTNPNPAALSPADRRDWDLATLAVELEFSTTSELCAALGSIDSSGYSLFALTDERSRRVISAPRRWLKALQRKANEKVFSGFWVSDSVYNCRGRGVIANAERHIGNNYLTVVDVNDCFPCTSTQAVLDAFATLGLRPAVAGALTRLTTYHGFLPQGPPTSPAVLNVVFRPIDEALADVARAYDAVYTRYMDDLAFSGNRPLGGLDRGVERVLRQFGYRGNSKKRRVWGPNDRHTVTKIVVNTKLNPEPEFLHALSMHLTRLEAGNCQLTEAQLRGKINWVTSLDKELGRSFAKRLDRRSRAITKARRAARA